MTDESTPRIRALVVDDETFIRQLFTKMLERFGVEVVGVAESGDAVVDLYARHKPDLVVMDIAMPRMDGLSCLAALRELHPEACVLICTSFSSRQYALEADRLGAAGFLNKPFDMARIRAKLEELFPGRLAPQSS